MWVAALSAAVGQVMVKGIEASGSDVGVLHEIVGRIEKARLGNLAAAQIAFDSPRENCCDDPSAEFRERDLPRCCPVDRSAQLLHFAFKSRDAIHDLRKYA